MSIEAKDITQLEFSFGCWLLVDVADLENVELWRSGRVKRYWMKSCRLYMELDDGSIVEEDVSGFPTWQDYKWPLQTMVEAGKMWYLKGDEEE